MPQFVQNGSSFGSNVPLWPSKFCLFEKIIRDKVTGTQNLLFKNPSVLGLNKINSNVRMIVSSHLISQIKYHEILNI